MALTQVVRKVVFGGKRGRGTPGKTSMIGMKSRDGDVKASVLENLKADIILDQVKNGVSVSDAEVLITDELPSYGKVDDFYSHETVKHLETFINGNVHTYGVGNFWSLLKRGIIGVFHRVSAKYLQACLDEVCL